MIYVIVKRTELFDALEKYIEPFKIVEVEQDFEEFKILVKGYDPKTRIILRDSYSTIEVKRIIDFDEDLRKLHERNTELSIYFI